MKPKKKIQRAPPDYQYAREEYGVTPKQVDTAAKRALREIAADRKAGKLAEFTGKLPMDKPRQNSANKSKGKGAWPKTSPERMHAVETALHAAAAPIAPADLAKQFARAKPAEIAGIHKTLETFGRARKAGEGKFKA